MTIARSASKHEIAAWILAGFSLVLVLKLRVLPALLAGLLVYQLVHTLAPRLRRRPSRVCAGPAPKCDGDVTPPPFLREGGNPSL